MGPRSIWGGGRLVVEPQVRVRRLVRADVRRIEERAAEHRVEPAQGLDLDGRQGVAHLGHDLGVGADR